MAGTDKTQRRKPSLFSRALTNQYNLILLAGAGLFALTTFSWVPLIIGAGVEALWLTLGADSVPFRKWVMKKEAEEDEAARVAEAQQILSTLDGSYVARHGELAALAAEIAHLAAENPSLETRLVQTEMAKIDRLLFAFLQMAVVHQRMAGYLEEVNEVDIQRDIDKADRALAKESSRQVIETLRQSRELAQKRLKQHAKVVAAFKVLTVKMDTLEKSLRYLKPHVLGMGKSEELSSEIEGLVVGIESVEMLDEETDALVTGAARARAAQGQKAVRG